MEPRSKLVRPLGAGVYACVIALALGAPLSACESDGEERLGGLVDACLQRESDLRGELGTCEEELEAARSALTGEGVQGPTEEVPLMPMRARVRTRPREDPQLEFDARSYTHKTVHSFYFRARLFNAFDELVPCDPSETEGAATCPAGAEEYRDLIEVTVEPRRSERVIRPLPDHERVTKTVVTIYEVRFDDGTTWEGSAVGYPAPPIRRQQEDDEGDRPSPFDVSPGN